METLKTCLDCSYEDYGMEETCHQCNSKRLKEVDEDNDTTIMRGMEEGIDE